MSYIVERIDMNEALKDISAYEYALIYGMSRIVFCKIEELSQINWDECLEARLFDNTKELHIYEQDNRRCAVKITGMIDENCLMKKYVLQDYYFGKGKYLCVCGHLGYDEDGQAFVALTRLTGIA